MKLLANLFVLYQLEIILVSSIDTVDKNRCPPYPTLNSLPGNGWCSLREIEMSPVFAITYNKCQVLETATGNYLVPDYLHIIPKSTSDVDTTQELIESYENYASSIGFSISQGASAAFMGFSAATSFSLAYQNMKKSQVINQCATSRITGRYVLHAASLDEYTAELHPGLKSKLSDAIDAITAGHLRKASLIVELAVRSHGTHAITGIDLGGVVVKDDYISKKYLDSDSSDKLALSASASIGFAKLMNAKCSFDFNYYNDKYNSYLQSIKSTEIKSYGGELFKSATLNISNWVESLPNYLVAVDRTGIPMPDVVTPRHFPNVNQSVLAILRRKYADAIMHFNAINVHIGCMNQYSHNFDFNANIADKFCDDPPTNYNLGGFYQTCHCEGDIACAFCALYDVNNHFTKNKSCPNMFEPVFLNSGWIVQSIAFFEFSVQYRAYWCAASVYPIPPNTGLLFGGVFTSTKINPLTGSKSCPPNFSSNSILHDLVVCTSFDYESGFNYSVPFGGFFSCTQGNPLAAISIANEKEAKLKLENAPRSCGRGYSQHAAAIDDDCVINYCVRANSFGANQKEIPIVLPPFQKYDEMFYEETRNNSVLPHPNATVVYEPIVVHEPLVVIIALGSGLGFVIASIVIFVILKKCNRSRVNDHDDVRLPLIGNIDAAGYQSLTGNEPLEVVQA